MAIKLSFSGHDTFSCKQLWLKKGYDFIREDGRFSGDEALIELGVGKNMVNSMRYWLKSFGLLNEEEHIQELAEMLFGENGLDPYIEDLGTSWLLHYYLIKQGRASTYSLFFNEFRKDRFDFTKSQLKRFLINKCRVAEFSYNENTIESDIEVFIKSYILKGGKRADIEDEYSGILLHLNLMTLTDLSDDDEGKVYRVDNLERDDLPWEIVLYTILDNLNYTNVISFKELEVGHNSPGLIFALNEKGLYSKIEQMEAAFPTLIKYSTTAGNRVLTIRKDQLNKNNILEAYYGR